MSTEKVLVTGATGQLGSRIVQQLLRRLPATSIVAGGRKAEKAQSLTARGVEFRVVDYDNPSSIDAAMAAWTTNQSYNTRKANVIALLSAYVWDDNTPDLLSGGAAQDLFFSGDWCWLDDIIVDRSGNEYVVELDES